MGIRNKITAAFAYCLALGLFSACSKLDIRGMFFSYETVENRVEQSLEWNESHPFREITVATEDYEVCAMGDSHVGGTQNLDSLIAIAIRENAAALVMDGDLTSGHAEDFTTYAQHMPADSLIPVFNIVGNHDLYYNGWESFFSLFGSSTYYFAVKTPSAQDLFLCLDTGGGTLGKTQLEWVETVLEDIRPLYRHCIIATHNNLYRFRKTSSTNPVLEEAHYMLNLFTEHDVAMVVMGHDHVQHEESFGMTSLITMDALLDLNEDAGYLKIKVGPEKVDHELIRF